MHVYVLRATLESLAMQVSPGKGRRVRPGDFEAEGTGGPAGGVTTEPRRTGTPAERGCALGALAELDPAAATILILRDVERLPAADVEQVLDLTPADQRALLHAGRAAIWKALA